MRLARSLSNYDNPKSLGVRRRVKFIGPLLAMIEQAYHRYGCVNLLDVDGIPRYWHQLPEAYLESRRVSITLVNIGPITPFVACFRFKFIRADGCDLHGFAGGSFHIAHSNSVIEHVGGSPCIERFAREVRRVAEKCFIQTPDFWCPIEPHCMTPLFHWLPRRVRVWLVRRVALGHWPRAADRHQAECLVDGARLLTRRELLLLFPGARIIRERILRMPKSLIVII